jgi:hypothetical protein
VSPATSSASGRPEPPAIGCGDLDRSKGCVAAEPDRKGICLKRVYSAQAILVEELVEALYDLVCDDGDTDTPPCISADTE